MARNLLSGFDYTNKDYTALREMMLAELKKRMPEYTDLSESDAGVVLLEAFAKGLDISHFYLDILSNETFLSTLQQRNNAMKWCKTLNYTPKYATPAMFRQVFVLTFARSSDTLIPQGTVVKAVDAVNEVKYETVEDLIIPAGKLGNEQDVNGNYLYQVDIVQGVTVVEEVLGSSNGTPSQIFTLNYSPVIANSIVVFVFDGADYVQWNPVNNFMDSQATAKDFMIQYSNANEAQVVFGDGVFGLIPVSMTNNIISTYRVGGGTIGNVGARQIAFLDANISYISATFNPSLPFVYGQDQESIDEIRVNAPTANRTLWGALTLTDFADILVANFQEIKMAIARRSLTDIDAIDIFILLNSGEDITTAYQEQILDFFDENNGGRKIVGVTDITINNPTFIPLKLESSLVVEPYFFQEEVETKVVDYVRNYFLTTARDFNKGYISLSQIVTEVMDADTSLIEGIKSFRFTRCVVDGNEVYSNKFNITGDIVSLGEGEIVRLASHIITSSGGALR